MQLHSPRQAPTALDLEIHGIGLGRDHDMAPWRRHDRATAPGAGLSLAMARVQGPEDVHYPAWERHPDGDELLLLVSGALSVEYRDGQVQRQVALTEGHALIVARGLWHRVIVHAPSRLVSLTPRKDTLHHRDPVAP